MGDLVLFRRLLRQTRPYWVHLGVVFGIGLVASPIALLNPVPLNTTSPGIGHAEISWMIAGIFSSALPAVP